jgi:hypothetical protein
MRQTRAVWWIMAMLLLPAQTALAATSTIILSVEGMT